MGWGGKRAGAGRPKGRRDKATADQLASLEELARTHTETALNALVTIATTGESEAARVAAANALLDRGYGRPKQAMVHTGKDDGPVQIESLHVSAREIVERRIAGLAARIRQSEGPSLPH